MKIALGFIIALAFALTSTMSAAADQSTSPFWRAVISLLECNTLPIDGSDTYHSASSFPLGIIYAVPEWVQIEADKADCNQPDTRYTVARGDLSLWTIAGKLDIPFGSLLDANWHMENVNLIHVGDVIKLPNGGK